VFLQRVSDASDRAANEIESNCSSAREERLSQQRMRERSSRTLPVNVGRVNTIRRAPYAEISFAIRRAIIAFFIGAYARHDEERVLTGPPDCAVLCRTVRGRDISTESPIGSQGRFVNYQFCSPRPQTTNDERRTQGDHTFLAVTICLLGDFLHFSPRFLKNFKLVVDLKEFGRYWERNRAPITLFRAAS
jgi:hypothetical protein